MELKKEQIELLRKPLDAKAISPHPTKTYLSTIKAIYVVERLNLVFGIGGWRVENQFIEKVEKMVVVKSVFICGDIYIEAFGGNDNVDLGDAYKGACTDALTKIGSYLEIGMDVFKGLSTNSALSNNSTAPTTYTKTPAQTAEDDNKPWIDDDKFQNAITVLLKAGKIATDTNENEIMKILRKNYKVAKKYQDLIKLALTK